MTTRHSWLTVACLCFLVNALALTGAAHLRLAHAAHHTTPQPPSHRVPIVGGVANGPPNPGPWLPPYELAVGDSLTVGLFTTSQSTTYPLDVEAEMQTHQSPGEVAHGYWTTADVLAALPSALPTLASVYQLQVVELGTNDWHTIANLATFEANYRAILQQTAGRRQRLVCLSTWRDPAQVNASGETAGQYDAAIQQMCSDAGGVFVSLASIYQQPDSHCPVGVASWAGTCDGWHPGDIGASRIAQAIVSAYTTSGSLITRQRSGPRGPLGRGERWPR